MHVVGTAGHVDHGKSALVERLTGIDPDRFAEEKRRGLTIDLGFAWLTLPSGNEVGIVDVPGHERFIKNMLAGAGGVSICLFVVAANEGWKPQSAEHLAIVDVLGISGGVIALTKSDLVDRATIEQMSSDVSRRLVGTSLESATLVPCSAATGDGIDSLVRALDDAVADTPPPRDRARPRLWVDRSFTISGAGTVVTGTLTDGVLTTGQSVEVQPSGHKARIRSIQNHKRAVAEIGPGNRVALNLSGLERREVKRGDAVVLPQQWIPTRRADAVMNVLPQFEEVVPHDVTEKGAYLLYVGSAEVATRVSLLEARQIAPGDKGFVHFEMAAALPLVFGDRFVVRDAGRRTTIGGGWIVDPFARPPRRRDPDRIALLQRLAEAERASDPAEWALRTFLDDEGEIPVDRLLSCVGATSLPADVTVIDGIALSGTNLRAAAEKLSETLRAYHQANPLARGMDKPAAATELGVSIARVTALAAASADIADDGRTIRLVGHTVRFDDDLERARAALLERLDAAGFTPPPIAELSGDARLLKAMSDNGDIVKVGDFFLTSGRAAEARKRVRSYIEESGPVTVAQIRDLLTTSRKYAVPLCEWLDTTGATLRRGDVRILGPRA